MSLGFKLLLALHLFRNSAEALLLQVRQLVRETLRR